MTKEEFVVIVDQVRKSNKDEWYFWNGEVNGKPVRLKGYNTWLQVFEVNGVDHSNCMERKVSEFKRDLKEGIEYA